ncbi:class I adenylate-forming enzyme family protein [Azospirillum doebereinerae]
MFADFRVEDPKDLARRLESEPIPSSIYDVLTDTARRHGTRTAWNFFDDGAVRSWGEALALVDTAAAAFAGLGIAAGTHVAVMLPNVEQYPVAWLALGKLGAVMVPVNTAYTPTEVGYILDNSRATHLIVDGEFLPIIRDLGRTLVPEQNVVVVGEADGHGQPWATLMRAAEGRSVDKHAAGPEQLLSIQYTSGTTGFSKGCLLGHDYWIILGRTALGIFATDLERFYLGQSFFYMVGQRLFMNAMLSGGMVIGPRRPGAKRFMRDVREWACDYAAVFEPIYKQPETPEDADNRLKITSVFALSRENHADYHRRFGALAQEFYGMTEIGAALYVPAHEVLARTGAGTCGVPTAFRQVIIGDPDGKPLPQGEVGELLVKGPGMLQGYYGNPEATAASFVDGWFRTGDLGRFDEDGYCYIVGRTKDMIRRSGENISAREVEAALRSLPEIQEAAVLPVPDPYRGEEVKAYVQLAPGISPDTLTPQRIFDHCATMLATFKIPRYLEYRDGFVVTDSQRVQKKFLVEEKPDLRAGSYDRAEKRWL